jgi:thymidine phosphorylase
MILPQEIIAKKCGGQILSEVDIGIFVDGLTSKRFNDAQVGAMAMAIFLQGLNKEETVYLTTAMMNSGTVLSWDNVKNSNGFSLNGPILDKHSTGGVGDKVSFMLAAIVAACGGYVPMISGRGLGHTGGTADKLESITGFNVQPKLEQFQQIVADVGVAIISQTPELAPADRRLYAIRDITATVASIPLITASILSKKLAAGLDVLVMDIKVGNGAQMTDLKQARALAHSITTVANNAGVNTQAIITDMNQVLGNTAGNALEVEETINYLTGEFCEPRLHQVVVSLAKAMLVNSNLAIDEESAYFQINRALESGKAAEIFSQMISALGGPSDLLEKPWNSMSRAKFIVDILSPCGGYINTMQTRDIGFSVVGLGGGRTSNDQAIDHSVGFDHILPIGTQVNKGDILARAHGSTKESAELASKQYIKALTFSDTPAPESKIIY